MSLQHTITAAALNPTGEWVAFGSAQLGQLLVWEWRSETYVLKQQGHYYDVCALGYSPDGVVIVKAADGAEVPHEGAPCACPRRANGQRR